jgi:hypothetical protein
VEAGLVGHGEAVGDAFEDVAGGDGAGAVDDLADPALAEFGGGADTGLAESSVLAQELEQRAHVAFAQGPDDLGAVPEGRRDGRGVECACPHGIPSVLPGPGSRVTGWDQQLTRHLTVRTPCVMGS